MAIYERHKVCYYGFGTLCDTFKASRIRHGRDNFDIEVEFDRYKLWAGSVGAMHTGSKAQLSLDHRLREASFYRDQVFKLLEVLHHHIQSADDILTGKRTPFEDLPPEPRSDEDTSSEVSSEPSNTSGNESPWDISDSESAGADHSSEGPQSPSIGHASQEMMQPENTSRPSELRNILSSLRLTVTSLHKLPLRRPAPMDRLRHKATDLVMPYEHYDCLYVKDKLRLPEKDESTQYAEARAVATRLGRMITRRRQLLLYRRSHHEKLNPQLITSRRSEAAAERSLEQATGETQESFQKIDDNSRPNITAQSQVESSSFIPQTIATTLKHDVPELADGASDLVVPSAPATSIIASETTRKRRVHIPPRPVDRLLALEAFECPYCCITVPDGSDLYWKKHVISDLQPYVCTYPECALSDHFFDNRDAWFEHERQYHRTEFFCNTIGHKSFADVAGFGQHMKEDHAVSLDLEATKSTMDAFRRPSQAEDGICNLCFEQSKNLKIHVARHLEEFAVFALPRASFNTDDEACDGESDVAQGRFNDKVGEDESKDSCGNVKSQSQIYGLFEPSDFVEDSPEYSRSSGNSIRSEEPDIPDAEVEWDGFVAKYTQAREGFSNPAPRGVAYEPYHHQTLEDKYSIRLLELLPGRDGERLQCHLRIFHLSDCPAYEVASHTRGDQKSSLQILCDGKSLRIPNNLFHCLMKLRRVEEQHLFWTSFICIDFENLEERGNQVEIMGSIFENATQVRFWLDEGLNFDVEAAFDLINDLYTASMELSPSVLTETMTKFQKTAEEVHPSQWEVFGQLLSYDWTTRLWTLPEIGLAKDFLVICGTHEITWKKMLEVARAVESWCPQLVSDYHLHTIRFVKIGEWDFRKSDIPIGLILDDARDFGVSNPKDRVFALLGHAAFREAAKRHDSTSIIPVDYTMSSDMVYLAVAKLLLKEENPLTLLSIAGPISNKSISWLPPWDIPRSATRLTREPPFLYHAAGHTNPQFTQTDLTLTVKGLRVDPITWSSAAFPNKDPKTLARRLGEIWRNILPVQGNESNVLKNFCLTLNAGRPVYDGTDARHPLAEDEQVADFLAFLKDNNIELWLKNELEETYGVGRADRFIQTRSPIFGRRFFVTKKRFFGLGPGITSRGDAVCIIFGAHVPFIVWEAGAGDFTLWGECYVHGLMNGEAIDMWERGELKEENFALQ